MSEHFLRPEPTHPVWDRSLEPRLHIASHDVVYVYCQDASGGQVHTAMTFVECQGIDRTRIHSLTGPICVQAAEPGVVLGLGFLNERFAESYLFQ